MEWMGPKRQEHLSRFLGDLAKAIFVVGLASHLFREFPNVLRALCGIGFLGLAVLSLWLHPKN